MTFLNKKSVVIFTALIELMKDEQALKIDNTEETFMPLHIEKLYSEEIIEGLMFDVYSLAHYFKQNGDLVPDPDMTFAVSEIKGQKIILPMSFQNQMVYLESMVKQHNGWGVNGEEQKDHAEFANMWLENIVDQQKLQIPELVN